MKAGVSSDTLKGALTLLDGELAKVNEFRSLVVCGGGALSVMGVISRETRDLDVITPDIDPVLLSAAQVIAAKLGLDREWLNNGPSGFIKDLESYWELRTQVIFEGSFLVVKSLGRRDLLATKLQGLCDRDENDLEDILFLKPTVQEIESLRTWLLQRDASVYWPERVDSQLSKLVGRIAHGK